MTHDDTAWALTPAQVAAQLGISVRTLNRWEASGDLVPIRLPSGHRRYRQDQVDALLHGRPAEAG